MVETIVARAVRPIPIAAARRIAEEYGYDQVVIYARRVGEDPEPCGEHLTTYGVTKAHCRAAGAISAALQRFMGWKPSTTEAAHG
ncbi:hypothetical protein ACLBYG_22105 [Methylobacterium sp. D53M]